MEVIFNYNFLNIYEHYDLFDLSWSDELSISDRNIVIGQSSTCRHGVTFLFSTWGKCKLY